VKMFMLEIQRPRPLQRKRRAQGMVEYGLAVAAIVLVALGGAKLVETAEHGYFSSVASQLADVKVVPSDIAPLQ